MGVDSQADYFLCSIQYIRSLNKNASWSHLWPPRNIDDQSVGSTYAEFDDPHYLQLPPTAVPWTYVRSGKSDTTSVVCAMLDIFFVSSATQRRKNVWERLYPMIGFGDKQGVNFHRSLTHS